MNHLSTHTKLKDLQVHLRNKNIAVIYEGRNLVQRGVNRMSMLVSKLQGRFAASTENFELVISEQTIENPLVFRNLCSADRSILDFGGYEGLLPLQLASLGHEVTVFDQRAYPFAHPNLSVLVGDLFQKGPQLRDKFDVVLSISTIEHLGLGHYGDPIVDDGDARGVSILWDLVKEGGKLMVSLPAGKPAVHRGYRVYNQERIEEMFPSVTATYWYMKDGRQGHWLEVSPHQTEDLIYGKPNGQLPVEAIVFVICDKSSGNRATEA